MDQMKKRKDPLLHTTWGQQWVQDLVLVDPGSHLLSQCLATTSSQTLAAKNTNMVASRSKFFLLISALCTFFFSFLSFNILLHNWRVC
jgi:hypothetical protein